MVILDTFQQVEYLLECGIELVDHFLLDLRTYRSAEMSAEEHVQALTEAIPIIAGWDF
jgi:hypothetical protein